MRYRSEIDGLRAVAVMPVILFHAGFNIFSGGFVGVDIFFVISGFLITRIILTELKNDNFSILKFYERRARRILPALFTVIAVSFPLAWMILLPSDMWNFSHTMITVSGFYSNIFFWKTSGYFESAAELKPLLHTWSLAVEEQYYVFFPLFLLIAWRFGQRAIMVILLIVGCVSLALAQWGAVANPDAAFYLLPTRGWELLIGAFVAFYDSSENKPTLSHLQNQILSAIGLGLLLYALFRFDKHTPFPSVYALVPTVGAALIILSATQDTFVGKLLGSKAFVGIGLISYSAYLWHQPLLAFARHASFDQPSESTYALLVTVSLVLAYFTWKYIEAPFRNHQKVGRKTIFVFAVVGSLTMAGVGEYGKLDHGHQNRFGLAQRAMLDYFSNSYPDWQYFKRVNWYTKFHIECDFFDIPKEWEGHPTQERKSISPSCYTRDPSKKHAVFLWGDSHAQHFYIGLKDNLPSDWQIMQVASSACRPSLKFDKNSGNYCPYSNYFAYQTILDTKPDVVVIGQDGGHNLAFMNEVTERLTRAGVGKVVFAGPSPHWLKGGLPSVVAYKFNGEPPRYSSVGLDQSVREHDALLKKGFKQTPSARYVSLFDYFCHADGCLIYYGDDVKAGITTYDYGHLATPASDQFAKDVLVPTVIGAQ